MSSSTHHSGARPCSIKHFRKAALDYMRGRALTGPVIHQLATHRQTQFADQATWQTHLDRLGISALRVTPDPVCIATEGALWGSIQAHGLLREMVIVSDDAGQFAIGQHALCWVHAERLVHKLDTFTDLHRAAQQRMRALIWRFYDDLTSRLPMSVFPIFDARDHAGELGN